MSLLLCVVVCCCRCCLRCCCCLCCCLCCFLCCCVLLCVVVCCCVLLCVVCCCVLLCFCCCVCCCGGGGSVVVEFTLLLLPLLPLLVLVLVLNMSLIFLLSFLMLRPLYCCWRWCVVVVAVDVAANVGCCCVVEVALVLLSTYLGYKHSGMCIEFVTLLEGQQSTMHNAATICEREKKNGYGVLFRSTNNVVAPGWVRSFFQRSLSRQRRERMTKVEHSVFERLPRPDVSENTSRLFDIYWRQTFPY